MLNAILTAEIFASFLIFARIGTAFITLPTIGEAFISTRARLILAVMITLLVAPILLPKMPNMPARLGDMIYLVMVEILYGAFIGMAAKILFSALTIAGSFISMFTGLASAMMFNPGLGDQGSFYSVFLSILGTVLFFATNMHHLLIRATLESYAYFLPGQLPPMGDFTQAMSKLVAQSFLLGLHLSAPFILVAMLLYMLLGVMARLMPQLQIFFVALPIQVLGGFFILLVVIGGLMLWFLDQYAILIAKFLMPLG